MSKRLQVVLEDEELADYERTAQTLGLTTSEWVRQSLRRAKRQVSIGDVDRKLAAIRKAASYEFQGKEVDIDTMLAEIEAGRLAEIEAGMGDAGDI
jgi:hypothetical protein